MFKESFIESEDGLNIYYRDYPADADQHPPLLCLHGLTRNSSDFEQFVEFMNGSYRLIMPEMRGRGRSDYDPNWQNYHLQTYVADTWRLLDKLKIDQVIVVGMSMGGLMSMSMAAQQPNRILAVILNDIGPELAPEGITRIMGYLETEQQSFTMEEALERVIRVNGEFFPTFTDDDWRDFTLRLYKEIGEGKYQTAYDKGITRALTETTAVPDDPWIAFGALANIPVLVVRGALSDLLSVEIVENMRQVAPNLQYVEVPNRGHHPFLDEPESISAIRSFLDTLE